MMLTVDRGCSGPGVVTQASCPGTAAGIVNEVDTGAVSASILANGARSTSTSTTETRLSDKLLKNMQR